MVEIRIWKADNQMFSYCVSGVWGVGTHMCMHTHPSDLPTPWDPRFHGSFFQTEIPQVENLYYFLIILIKRRKISG